MKKYYKKDVKKVVDEIVDEIETFDNLKVNKVYVYEKENELKSFIHFHGQGLLQFIYDDLKKNNKDHTYNWKDVTDIFVTDELFSKKRAIDTLFEELN